MSWPLDCWFLQFFVVATQWHTQEFCSEGGVQQIQLRTEGRENGNLGAVRGPLNLQMSETCVLIRL
jgi:hypothetical protein